MKVEKEEEKMIGKFFLPVVGPGTKFCGIENTKYIQPLIKGIDFLRISFEEDVNFWKKVSQKEQEDGILFGLKTKFLEEATKDNGILVQFEIDDSRGGDYLWACNIEPIEFDDVSESEKQRVQMIKNLTFT